MSDLPPRAMSIHDLVAGDLRARIKFGDLSPGQRLVEAELVAELGVSRATIRTVLGQLASEGFVTIERNAGARVRNLDPKGISDIYEVRATLEGRAAALVAGRIQESACGDAVERLLAENAQFNDLAPLADYWNFNEGLHQSLLDLADNAMLAQLGQQARTLSYHYHRQASSTPESGERPLSIHVAVTQHRAILACILAGNAQAAEVAMRAHILHNGERVAAHFAWLAETGGDTGVPLDATSDRRPGPGC